MQGSSLRRSHGWDEVSFWANVYLCVGLAPMLIGQYLPPLADTNTPYTNTTKIASLHPPYCPPSIL